MPYAVNVSKSSSIHNDAIGDLNRGIAKRITTEQVNIAKHLIGVVVFDDIEGVEIKPKLKASKEPQKIYGMSIKR